MNTTDKSQVLIQRYIATATSSIAEKERKDIALELEGDINDRIEAAMASGLAAPEATTKVLSQMGDPAVLADSFSNQPTALLSGSYFRSFKKVFPKVLIVVFFVILMANIMLGMFSAVTRTPSDFDAPSIVTALLAASGLTVLIYFILERAKVALPSSQWNIQRLAEGVPDKFLHNRIEEIIGFVFSTLALLFFLFLPQIWPLIVDAAKLDPSLASPPELLAWWRYGFWFVVLIIVNAVQLLVTLIHPFRSIARAVLQLILNLVTALAVYNIAFYLRFDLSMRFDSNQYTLSIMICVVLIMLALLAQVIFAFIRGAQLKKYRAMMK